MPPAWIKSAVCDILSAGPGSAHFDQPCRVKGTRCVQVIAVNDDIRSLTVSDGDMHVHAFMTKECFDDIFSQYSSQTLKFGMINLVDFCFSTVLQAAGNQDMGKLTAMNIMFPLALHCFKITHLGATDSTVIGSPTPLNASKTVSSLLQPFKYHELRTRLALAQFPVQKVLPDWGKLLLVAFLSPRAHSNLVSFRAHVRRT